MSFQDRPVIRQVQGRFFRDTPRSELARLLSISSYIETFETPLSRNGLDLSALRQGSFFTREGQAPRSPAATRATGRPHRKTPSDTAICGATMIASSDRMRRVIHSPPDGSAARATAMYL